MSLERLREKLQAIQARVPMVRGRGEEATKQALVLPMLDALGYDIWNPTEVCPEFEADFAVKKAGQKEKVDLAIVVDGHPRAFLEVKPVDSTLDGHHGQLARYFNGAPTVSLAVLTNGVEYRFFTDTGEPNLLDAAPFFTMRLDALELPLDVLARFHKSLFSPGAIREFATELNYTAKMTAFLRGELDLRNRDPSDGLVRWVLSNEGMFEGRLVASVVERFRGIVKNSLQIVLRDVVRRSVAALDDGVSAPAAIDAPVQGPSTPAAPAPPPVVVPAQAVAGAPPDPPAAAPVGVEGPARPVTTAAELAAFAIVKDQFQSSAMALGTIFDATTKREVPIEIAFKDTTGYCGFYFNKPGWWFCRIQLDSKQPWAVFNLEAGALAALLPTGVQQLPPIAHGDARVAIRGPDDLHALNRVMLAAMQRTIQDRRIGRVGDGATEP
jgi:hypothetical protein